MPVGRYDPLIANLITRRRREDGHGLGCSRGDAERQGWGLDAHRGGNRDWRVRARQVTRASALSPSRVTTASTIAAATSVPGAISAWAVAAVTCWPAGAVAACRARPSAFTIGPDGAFYVSNNGASSGIGEVLRIEP